MPSPKGTDQIGNAPSDPTAQFDVPRATAWFMGMGYNVAGK
jgi:hypothetical protein